MFRKALSSLVLMLGLLLSACAQAAAPTPTTQATAEPIMLIDSLSRQVALAIPARRVITLAPSNTEIIFAIGAGGKLVGRDEFSDYPPEVKDVQNIGSLYPKVNAEAIVALKPDLVLAGGITNPDDVKALADLGLTVYAAHNAVTLDDIYTDILAIGQLTGQMAQAEKLVADMQGRVQAVIDRTAGITDKPKVFYEIDATDPAKPWTAGSGSFIDQLLTLAGGANVGAAVKDQYAQISLEELVAQDPAIIVLGSYTFGGQTPELVKARVGWDKIAAVKNDKTYTFDDNLVSRPGPRVVDGLEALARLIHPELFP